jgi:hypothetical protein
MLPGPAISALVRCDRGVGREASGAGRNADQHGYDLAQQVVAGDHAWLEQGIV